VNAPVPPAQAGNLLWEEAVARAGLISDVHYSVALDLTSDEPDFGCRTTVRFRASQGGQSTWLDYVGRPERMECNGTQLEPAAFDGTRIHLPVRDGENVVRVLGTGAYSRVGAGLHRFVDPLDGAAYLHTKFEPFDAHRVYPCFDQPDLKAVFDLEVTAPESWQVIANGAENRDRQVRDGRAHWSFAPTPRLSTYLTAIVAGPFHRLSSVHGDIPLTLWTRGSYLEALKEDAEELFELTGRGLAYYTQLFGQPYPFDSYDQVFVPEYAFGAMEHPGCVTFNEQFIFRSRVTSESRRRRTEVVLHEMAHMWFGNLVTMRWWDDLWLNESFATLMAAMAQDSITEFGPAWVSFAHHSGMTARHADQLPTSHPVAVDTPDTDAVRLNFDPLTYRKGAAVLRQLALELGQDTFVSGIRDYLERHAWANAELGDFLAALGGAAGTELGDFSRQWLCRSGVSTVTARGADGRVELTRVPEPDPEPRRVRVRAGGYRDGASGLQVIDTVRMDLVGSTAEMPWNAADADVVLANDDGAAYLKVRLDPGSRSTALDRLSALPDPMARAVVWGALWDDVLDARLTAREFATCVLNHGGTEPDVGVLQSLAERGVRAVLDYGERVNIPVALGALSAWAAHELDAAAPGSDRQLVWARALVSTAGSNAVDLLQRMLTAGESWPGLEVDLDLRWRLLTRLAVVGEVVDELIADTAVADPGGAGDRQARTVRAARSTAVAKDRAWADMLDQRLSLAERRAVMTGWQQPGQEELLTPWVEDYFTALDRIWADQGPESALAFCRAVYPHTTTVDQAVLARTDQVLAKRRLPRDMCRILREERAELARAVAARTYDAGPDLVGSQRTVTFA
jgi:aminopeptidase N